MTKLKRDNKSFFFVTLLSVVVIFSTLITTQVYFKQEVKPVSANVDEYYLIADSSRVSLPTSNFELIPEGQGPCFAKPWVPSEKLSYNCISTLLPNSAYIALNSGQVYANTIVSKPPLFELIWNSISENTGSIVWKDGNTILGVGLWGHVEYDAQFFGGGANLSVYHIVGNGVELSIWSGDYAQAYFNCDESTCVDALLGFSINSDLPFSLKYTDLSPSNAKLYYSNFNNDNLQFREVTFKEASTLKGYFVIGVEN